MTQEVTFGHGARSAFPLPGEEARTPSPSSADHRRRLSPAVWSRELGCRDAARPADFQPPLATGHLGGTVRVNYRHCPGAVASDFLCYFIYIYIF